MGPTNTLQRPDLGATMEAFDNVANAGGYIATQVAPAIDVVQQTAEIGRIPLKALLQERETKRAPGAGYARASYEFETFSYACEEHGAEEPVDDRLAKIYKRYFDAEGVALTRAQAVVIRNREKRVADLLFNASTWGTAALATAVGVEWSTLASAEPIDDVDAAVEKVITGSGLQPNALILNSLAFRNLMRCEQIIDRLKDGGVKDVGSMTANAMADALAKIFFPSVPTARIIVAGGLRNSAVGGATPVPARIWSSEYAMVAKVADTQDPHEACVARSFHYTEDGSSLDGTVESYYQDSIRSNVIRVRHDTDELVMHTAAAHLLSNITA